MAISTIKWDGKGLQLDKYFMEHQIERPANEQLKEDEGRWITKDGHPIFIGGNNPEVKAFVKTLPHISPTATSSGWSRPSIHSYGAQVFDFVQALGDFTSQYSKQISDASYAINTKGVKAISDFEKQAELINNAVRESEPQSEPVYRGVGTTRPHVTLDNVKVGDVYTMGGIKSFSFDKSIALKSAISPQGGHSVLFQTVGPIKGVPAAAISEYPQEQEFISQGKFKVVAVKQMVFPDSGGHFAVGSGHTIKVVTLQQVGVF